MQTEKQQDLPHIDMSDNTEETPKGSCKRIISAKSQNTMMNSSLAAT